MQRLQLLLLKGASLYWQHRAWSGWSWARGAALLVRGWSWLSVTCRIRASRESHRPSMSWRSNTTMSSEEHCQGPTNCCCIGRIYRIPKMMVTRRKAGRLQEQMLPWC